MANIVGNSRLTDSFAPFRRIIVTTSVLIVAAGSGSRHGGDLPKQYQRLGGRAILRHTIEAFSRHPRIDAVRVVIGPDHEALYEAAAGDLSLSPPVEGGATRQESVRRGLEALVADAPSLVLIHDAARPLIDQAIIDRVLDALKENPAVVAATPVVDSLRRDAGGVVDRTALWQVQTPQGFHFQKILDAHRATTDDLATDDATLAEQAGIAITLVEGAMSNLKITRAGDIATAETFLAARLGDIRTGTGFDVHRFAPGDHVTICGVHVPHSHALEGHSDADVGLHAMTDAILGCIGNGDIGSHFSPADARWKGADSAQFLQHAIGLVADRGGVVAHLDVTIICERPKIGPHRAAMLAQVAKISGLRPDQISVKATTTEGLGFTGRNEGIAAQAVATVRLPFV
jgi:2-C-methyl-D-erythritol 4-phosphate cytidylyltransferase/2-C-methyl-D-erythritol 2,4-cyclodiphosphate synthase